MNGARKRPAGSQHSASPKQSWRHRAADQSAIVGAIHARQFVIAMPGPTRELGLGLSMLRSACLLLLVGDAAGLVALGAHRATQARPRCLTPRMEFGEAFYSACPCRSNLLPIAAAPTAHDLPVAAHTHTVAQTHESTAAPPVAPVAPVRARAARTLGRACVRWELHARSVEGPRCGGSGGSCGTRAAPNPRPIAAAPVAHALPAAVHTHTAAQAHTSTAAHTHGARSTRSYNSLSACACARASQWGTTTPRSTAHSRAIGSCQQRARRGTPRCQRGGPRCAQA